MSTENAELDAALRLTPHLDRGAELFEMCAACHGQDGHGASDGSVPAIAGQWTPVIVKQILDFRYDSRLDVRMQHFVSRHHLSDSQQLADVAAYVNSLPPRAATPPQDSDSNRARQGASLFGGSCASCHGTRAEGDLARRVPRLAGQHPEYVDEQLQDALEGRRPGMGRDHARLLAHLSSDDMDAIARYLSGI